MSWKKFKEQNIDKAREVKPWDLLNPKTEYASEEEANARYELCLGCPALIQFTKQCKKCGCFMAVKTKLKDSKCPIGKW